MPAIVISCGQLGRYGPSLVQIEPTPGGTPFYSDLFHTARIHIILPERFRSISDQIMQDFAKYTSVVDQELARPVGEWKLDVLSVPFGALPAGLTSKCGGNNEKDC